MLKKDVSADMVEQYRYVLGFEPVIFLIFQKKNASWPAFSVRFIQIFLLTNLGRVVSV
jgi:hypothetical protein